MMLFAFLAVLLMALPKGLWLWAVALVLLIALISRRRSRKAKTAGRF